MIVYVCDTCKATIEAGELRSGLALLVGDRAFCQACNPRSPLAQIPRTAAPSAKSMGAKRETASPAAAAAAAAHSSDGSGHGGLACDSCGREVDAQEIRGGLARISDGQIQCARCLALAARKRARGGADRVYLAGMVGLFLLLPAVSALIAWKLAQNQGDSSSGANEQANHRDAERPENSGVAASLQQELVEVRKENAALLERLDQLAGDLSNVQRQRDEREPGATGDAASAHLSMRLENLDRTIQRLETSLASRVAAEASRDADPRAGEAFAPPPLVANPAVTNPAVPTPAVPTPPVPSPQAPATPLAAVAQANAGDPLALLLDALTTGQISPALDLALLIENEDPTIRMMACKVVGMSVASSPSSSVDVGLLQKLMKSMRDRDPGVQRAAMLAAGLITNDRYIAWDDLSAEDYARITQVRAIWDGVEARSGSPDSDSTKPGER